MQTLIDQMTAALAQLDAQREALAAAIAALQGAAGAPTSEKPGRVAKSRPGARRGRRGATEAAAASGDTARPTGASSGVRAAAILTALKTAPQSLGAIAAATRMSKNQARYELAKLTANGQITASGNTTTRLYARTTT